MLTGLWKPWFVYRPGQIVRRLARVVQKPSCAYVPLRAAWGVDIFANPSEYLGRCLWTTGIYDLAVSELLLRLIRPGDFVVDAGANIGYMTLLAAVASGPRGLVMAFEPNPQLASVLRGNIDSASHKVQMAPVELRHTALGDRKHDAFLVLPDRAAELAHVEDAAPGHVVAGGVPISGAAIERAAGKRVTIKVEALDDAIQERAVGLMKIDVEGYELPVVQGASAALRAHRIRHVVFEDHQGAGSETALFLERAGYKVFSIGWSIARPLLAEGRPGQSVAKFYEAPSYLATIDPQAALLACRASGWRALRRQTRPNDAGLQHNGRH